MASSDNDEALELAIAMSMQQSPSAAAIPEEADNKVIDLTSDTEDESDDDDMKRAIALSLQEAGDLKDMEQSTRDLLSTSSISNDLVTSETPPQTATDAVPFPPSSGHVSFHGLDRRAMEQERLARLGKRKRDPSPERPLQQGVKARPAKDSKTYSTKSGSPSKPNLWYPTGAIKRTFATKYPRTDDITLDEVLQADSVDIAVISSFMWDSEWLYEKLNPVKVKQIWIMNAKDEDVQEPFRREMKETGVPNLKIHFPPMGGMIHSMHSKFMFLFGRDKLRFVVPTANMTPIDWGEIKNDWQPGVMENSVFLIDLPRRIDGSVGKKGDLTPFGSELVYFLEQLKVPGNVIEGVLKFDFSKTNHLAFVHSVGGSHKSESQYPTGLPGLAKAIQGLQLQDVQHLELDYAASSLGAINDALLQRIHLAAQGKTPTAQSDCANVRNHFRVYFPSDEAVQQSTGGPDCGGIITLKRQHYHAATFPRECFRNYDSTRRGMLSHNKLLFARGVKTDGTPFAWVYVGSGNISESAWGGQKVLKGDQLGSLNIRNWECGVVMPVPNEKVVDVALGAGEVPSMSVFEGTIEVPFVFPGVPYGSKQPWFFRG